MSTNTLDTSDWRSGDPVTLAIAGRLETGTAVVWRGRKPPHERFVKARMGSEPGITVWLNGPGWALGTGTHLFWCAECASPARSEDPKEILCLACDRGGNRRQNAPNEPDHVNVRWRSQDRAQGRKR